MGKHSCLQKLVNAIRDCWKEGRLCRWYSVTVTFPRVNKPWTITDIQRHVNAMWDFTLLCGQKILWLCHCHLQQGIVWLTTTTVLYYTCLQRHVNAMWESSIHVLESPLHKMTDCAGNKSETFTFVGKQAVTVSVWVHLWRTIDTVP